MESWSRVVGEWLENVLVGGLEHVLVFHIYIYIWIDIHIYIYILGIMVSTDEFTFFRGFETTNQCWIVLFFLVKYCTCDFFREF